MTTHAYAEIIESSLQSFLGQCWQWNNTPQFGSLVTVAGQERTIFGVVHTIQTGSMDPVRYPFAYQKTHEELLAEQPQIFEFLKTTFACIPLGYEHKGKIFTLMPPEPPTIHSFIAPATIEQSKHFFANNRYLHLLFGAGAAVANLDELLLALLKQQAELKILKDDRLHDFMNTFSLLTGNDYRRLKLFLQRAETLL
jgi:hypothetical protein